MSARVGVIGCGTIACWAHLPALRKIRGATLVAAADPDPAARARAALQIDGAVHERWADLIQRPDIDAVLISAPPLEHAELTMAAAGAGKHVYVEKPLATTSDHAHAAVEAVARAGIVGTVGFNYRCHPAHQRARGWLKAGRIGEVRAVQTFFCEPQTSRTMPHWKMRRCSGGGALLDLASHHIDLIRWFLDDDVTSVSARITSRHTEDDTVALAMTMQGGVEVEIFATFCAGPADCLVFIGEGGTIRVDRHGAAPILYRNLRWRYGVRRRWTVPTAGEAILWARRLAQPAYQPSFRRSIARFIDRVNGSPTSLPTLEDGARSLAVVLAAEDSARRRVPIVLS